MSSQDATKPQGKHQRVKKIPKAVHVEHRISVDDSIDDDYGVSNIKDIKGKWKNVSLLSDTQLNASSDMLKGLVCIQVCDPTEFSAIDANKFQPIASKQPSQRETALNKKLGSYKSINKFEDEGHDNEFATGSLQSQSKPPAALSAKDLIAKKQAALTKATAKTKTAIHPPTQPLPSKSHPIPSPPAQPPSAKSTKSTKSPKLTPPTPKREEKSKKQLEAEQVRQLYAKDTIIIDENSDSEGKGGLQWFDDLSDDEYTKQSKRAEQKKALQQRLELELFKAKMGLKKSLNEEFDEMHDIDEDEEFELEELVSGDETEQLTSSSAPVKALSSLVQLDGSDSDDDDYDDHFVRPNQRKPTQSTHTKLVPYTQPISAQMHSLEHYLTKSIQQIEQDEQDDFSQEPYYNSPNASTFHYHQSYQSWLPYNLHPLLQLSIVREQFQSPRPIQAETLLPAMRDHKDIVGIAQTGSGKTLAFLLPILQHIFEEREHRGEMDTIWLKRQTASTDHEKQGQHFKDNLSAIIITPTRELAQQISDQVKIFGTSLGLIKPTLIVGGIFLEKQIRLIKQNTSMIIATPGRLWDVMKAFGSPIDLTFLRFLVLDEADRMVAAGTFEELNHIIDHIHMALNRRHEEQQKVKTLIDERARQKFQEAMNPTGKSQPVQEDSAPTKRKRQQRSVDDDGNDDNDDGGKFKSRQRVEQNKRPQKIDFGPTFADAGSFNLDEYLAKIAKQRGQVTEAKSQSKDKGAQKTEQKTIPQKKPNQQHISSSSEEEEEEDVDDEEEEAEDEDIEDEDEDEDFETLYEDQMDDEDVEDEDEDAELLSEDDEVELSKHQKRSNARSDQNNKSDNGYAKSIEETVEAQREAQREALIEKYTNLPNKLPHKLQVFLFSATLALQDSAREQESKRTKISARELSKKQGLINSKTNAASQSVDDLAEQQRLQQLAKQYEDGKTRLVELSKRLTLESPYIIDLSSSLILPQTLQQYSVELAETTSRDQALYGLLYNQDISAIVFTNSLNMTRKVADFLKCLNINAVALHSDADQKTRMKIIEKFRKDCSNIHKSKQEQRMADASAGFENRQLQARGLPSSVGTSKSANNNNSKQTSANQPLKKYGSVLVCTDIVARGLDIPNLDLVVHYHVPFDAETYIHRCGRTARGTNSGKSVVIVAPQEDNLWRVIQHALNVGLARDKAKDGSKSDKTESQYASSDVKKINFNSKYLVHIRDRLGYAHQLAEKEVEDKSAKKEKEQEHKLRDALGFDDDEDWELTKKEKNRRKNETDGIIAHYRDQEKRSLQNAKVTLRRLLQTNIHTHGGSFDW